MKPGSLTIITAVLVLGIAKPTVAHADFMSGLMGAIQAVVTAVTGGGSTPSPSSTPTPQPTNPLTGKPINYHDAAPTDTSTKASPTKLTWALTDPILPPCNSSEKNIAGILRSCDTGKDFLFKDTQQLLYDRTKKLVQGYYNGQIVSFEADGDPKQFGNTVCDLMSGEGGPNDDDKNKFGGSCGSFCQINNSDYMVYVDQQVSETSYADCGGQNCKDPSNPTADTCDPKTCTVTKRVPTSQKHLHTDMSTCDRELGYVRGAWVRNVSEMWLKVVDELKSNKKVMVPSSSPKALAYSGGTAISSTAPCKDLATTYVKELNRMIASPSLTYAPWGGLSVSDCNDKGQGKALAACHVKMARSALENMYGYLLACIQFTYAMSDQLDFMILGGTATVASQPINGYPPDTPPTPDQNQAVQTATLAKTVFTDVMTSIKDECKYWLDNDIDIDDEDAVEWRVRECYQKGENSHNLGRHVGDVTKKMSDRIAVGGQAPYGWNGSNCYYCSRFPITAVDNYY